MNISLVMFKQQVDSACNTYFHFAAGPHRPSRVPLSDRRVLLGAALKGMWQARQGRAEGRFVASKHGRDLVEVEETLRSRQTGEVPAKILVESAVPAN